MYYGLSKSTKIVLSKSIFGVKNQPNFFKKKKSSKYINLGDPFLLKTFFLDSIFEPLYFVKLHSIFDELTFLVGLFMNFFLGSMLILGQKTYFLGPTISKIPQPN